MGVIKLLYCTEYACVENQFLKYVGYILYINMICDWKKNTKGNNELDWFYVLNSMIRILANGLIWIKSFTLNFLVLPPEYIKYNSFIFLNWPKTSEAHETRNTTKWRNARGFLCSLWSNWPAVLEGSLRPTFSWTTIGLTQTSFGEWRR